MMKKEKDVGVSGLAAGVENQLKVFFGCVQETSTKAGKVSANTSPAEFGSNEMLTFFRGVVLLLVVHTSCTKKI